MPISRRASHREALTPPAISQRTVRVIRKTVAWSAAVSAVPAVAGSFIFQTAYASGHGWTSHTAWLFPVSVDAATVGAAAGAMLPRSRAARLCGAGALAMSVVANVTGHKVKSGEPLGVHLILSSAWPPLALIGLVVTVLSVFRVCRELEASAVCEAPAAAPLVAEPPARAADPTRPAVSLVKPPRVPAPRGALAGAFAEFREAVTPPPDPAPAPASPTPVEAEAAAAALSDAELARHAAIAGVSSVRGVRARYSVSESRARRVAKMIPTAVSA